MESFIVIALVIFVCHQTRIEATRIASPFTAAQCDERRLLTNDSSALGAQNVSTGVLLNWDVALETNDAAGAYLIRYSIGSRVAGDRLVALNQDSTNYNTPQNTQLTVKYPVAGNVGNIVSYVEVTVEQSTNSGMGYVVSGGVGQRQIGVVIEAYATSYLNYVVKIYGY